MKKIFLWSLCFLLLIVLIPFCVGITSENNAVESVNINSTEDVEETTITELQETIELTNKEIDTICCMAMEYIEDDTDKQTKLAILSLCANNYLCLKRDNTSANNIEISKYSDTSLEELRKILSEGLVEFLYEGNMVYIPIVTISPGYTVTSEEYPYIQEIASPWDTLEIGYENTATECGISIAGIEYLCKKSSSAKEAICWYLPNFEVKYIEFT